MHLDTKTYIAGQPAIKVRDFLRKADGGLWDAAFARVTLNDNNGGVTVGTLKKETGPFPIKLYE